jgi:hypothetical protein
LINLIFFSASKVNPKTQFALGERFLGIQEEHHPPPPFPKKAKNNQGE